MCNSPLFDIIDREKFKHYIDSDLKLNSDSKFLFNVINLKIFLEAL